MRRMVWVLLLLLVACGGGAPAKLLPPPDANAVVDKLSAAGLPVSDRMTYDASNDVNKILGRPGQYVGKTSFRDTRLTVESADFSMDDGGTLETFATAADAKRRFDYVDGISQSPLFAEYHWLRGTTLLRVSHRLTPDQAKEYEAAFMKV